MLMIMIIGWPGASRSLARYQLISGGGYAVKFATSRSCSPRRMWTLAGSRSLMFGGSIRSLSDDETSDSWTWRDGSVHCNRCSSLQRGLLCPQVDSTPISEGWDTRSTWNNCDIDGIDVGVHCVGCLTSECRLFCLHVLSSPSLLCWEAAFTYKGCDDDDDTDDDDDSDILTDFFGGRHTLDKPRDLELDPNCGNVTSLPVLSRDQTDDRKLFGLTGFCGFSREHVVMLSLSQFATSLEDERPWPCPWQWSCPRSWPLRWWPWIWSDDLGRRFPSTRVWRNSRHCGVTPASPPSCDDATVRSSSSRDVDDVIIEGHSGRFLHCL